MGLTKSVNEFVRLCRLASADPYRCQASGGNVSVKLDGGRMLITESGSSMRDVSRRSGWAVLDRERLKSALSGAAWRRLPAARREAEYASRIRSASLSPGSGALPPGSGALPPGSLPSLEAGLHAFMGARYVVHLHSVSGILLGMHGRARALKLLDGALSGVSVRWVPPVLPGLGLAERLRSAAPEWRADASAAFPRGSARSAARGARGTLLCFVENHGLVWASDSLGALARSVEAFERFGRDLFSLRAYRPPHESGSRCCRFPRAWGHTACLCHWPGCDFGLDPLFPDFVVYFSMDAEAAAPGLTALRDCAVRLGAGAARELADRGEVFFAHALINTVAAERGCLKTMPGRIADGIRGLRTERARLARIGAASTAEPGLPVTGGPGPRPARKLRSGRGLA